MKSNEHIKQLIKLSQENPDLEIIPMVDTEIVAGNNHYSATITFAGGVDSMDYLSLAIDDYNSGIPAEIALKHY